MESNILDESINAYSGLVSSEKIVYVDETKRVSYALATFRLNPRIHHLVVLKEGSRQPLGVLTKREFTLNSEDKSIPVNDKIFRDNENLNLHQDIMKLSVNELEKHRFIVPDTTWRNVLHLFVEKYKNDIRLDYALIINNDKNRELYSIVTYKDALKYLKVKNVQFQLADIDYAKISNAKFESAYQTQKISDINLEDYRSIPVFDSENKKEFIGIIFKNSVSREASGNDLEVTDTQIMTPLSRFSRCKMKASLQPSEMIDLFLEYPEFTSIPVFDDADKFIGLMSYIDLLKSVLNKKG